MKIPEWIKKIAWSVLDIEFILGEIVIDDILQAQILILESEKKVLETKNVTIMAQHDLCVSSLVKLQTQINEMIQKGEVPKDPLETFWNNKIKRTNVFYKARDGDTVDVRQFINPYDANLIFFRNLSNDEKAIKCLAWVYKNIKYETEVTEWWKFSWETLKDGFGDCEDGAILMMNMMLRSGIPYWRIRLNTGKVKGGGHAYITYLRESDNAWYIMDWCYWYKESKNFGKTWKSAEKYYGIWFSWNQKLVFAKKGFSKEDFEVITTNG